ncbi:phage baseplate assembly protein V [Rahnella contaminans]|uniref:phage baseplate assembly protein V n=1 Tax=Rahnella contaminans TaxID=2703882 RepID=UPI003C2EF1D4
MASLNINRLLDPIMRRVRLIISRAKVTGIDDGYKAQNIQVTVLNGETLDNVERLTEYGLISVPLAGAEAVIGFINAVRDHPVALVVADRRTRIGGLKPGDSGLYHNEGHTILLTENGEIVITGKSLRMEIENSISGNCKTFDMTASESASLTSPAIKFNGAVETFAQDGESEGTATLNGSLKIIGTSTAADHVSDGISGAGHTHSGVQTGDGETGGPQ